MAFRTVRTRSHAGATSAAQPADRLAISSVLIGGLLIAAIVTGRCSFSAPQIGSLQQVVSESGQSPRVQPGYQPREVVSEVSVNQRSATQLAAGATPGAPTAQAEPTPAVAAGERLRISGTDGQGVLLRNSPRDADVTTRGFIEGWEVEVLERSGSDWARVRGPNAQEGWVPTRYLQH